MCSLITVPEHITQHWEPAKQENSPTLHPIHGWNTRHVFPSETKPRWPPSHLNSLTVNHLWTILPSDSGAFSLRVPLNWNIPLGDTGFLKAKCKIVVWIEIYCINGLFYFLFHCLLNLLCWVKDIINYFLSFTQMIS